MAIEDSGLYKTTIDRIPELPAAPDTVKGTLDHFRHIVAEESRYIVRAFPEYRPHDPPRHLNNLFHLADRVLGLRLYDRLNAAELVVLAFGLYGHDWGMAVSEQEEAVLQGLKANDLGFALVPGEPDRALRFLKAAKPTSDVRAGIIEYMRQTHGERSGVRITRLLQETSTVFASAVARVAAGHTIAQRRIEDPLEYPHAFSVFGLPN